MSASISLWYSPFGFSLLVSHHRKREASCRENILRRVSMLAVCRVELIHDLGKNQTKDCQRLQTRACHFRGAIYSSVKEGQKVSEIAAGIPAQRSLTPVLHSQYPKAKLEKTRTYLCTPAPLLLPGKRSQDGKVRGYKIRKRCCKASRQTMQKSEKHLDFNLVPIIHGKIGNRCTGLRCNAWMLCVLTQARQNIQATEAGNHTAI